MSIKWINYVWEESPYDGRRLLLHLALADFANDEGVCYPSQKTLAKKARCTETWVSLSIKQMIEDDLVEIVAHGSGRGRASTYRLKGLSELHLSGSKGLILNTERINSHDTLSIYKNHIEPKYDQAFDLFWNAYPRKVAKLKARDLFNRIMSAPNAPSIEQILNAVDKYKQNTVDIKYVAHPTTWLNQGRWHDEIETTNVVPAERDYEKEQVIKTVWVMRNAGLDIERVQSYLEDKRADLQEIGLTIFKEGN